MPIFDPTRPFDLPPLPPEGLAQIESRAVLKLCVSARSALAALDEAARTLPNPDLLLHNFVLLEAKASSEIESIVTTTDRLFQFSDQLSRQVDSATKETLRYRQALYQGLALLKERPLCTGIAEAVCTITKGVDMAVRTVPGTVLKNDHTGETIYAPPEGGNLLRELLSNWERFCHATPEDTRYAGDLDPLVRMAILHYQFEAIHPFTDGNGRTGRIINLLFLVEQGLLQRPVLFLSRAILQRRAEYYAGLLAVSREGAWEPWLRYMLEAVRDAATWTHQKIRAVQAQMSLAEAHLKRHAPALYSHELLLTIFAKPYCRIGDIVTALSIRRQAASRYLKTLSSIGLLLDIKIGREVLYVHPNLIEILKDDAQDTIGYEAPFVNPAQPATGSRKTPAAT